MANRLQPSSAKQPSVSAGPPAKPENPPTHAESEPGLSHHGAAKLGIGSIDQRALFQQVSSKLFGAAHEVRETQIGRFVVDHRLGAGGMGVVYLARDPELGRKVAIKLLHPEIAHSDGAEQAQRRMRNEARAMARVSHPNVVHIHEVGEHSGRLYLAMEYVRGATLDEWVREEPRSPREILDVFAKAGEGLYAAHRAKMVHRDFKPDNVLIGSQGVVKVADFGVAGAIRTAQRELGSTLDITSVSLATIEASTGGVLIGTPLYMSPEQILREKATPKSDQFAFCVALYEALVGERPYPGSTLSELTDAVTLGKRNPRPQKLPGVPDSVFDVLDRGLAVYPDDRWPSMRELIDALSQAAEPSWAARWSGLRPVAVPLGIVAIAVTAALGGYALAKARPWGGGAEPSAAKEQGAEAPSASGMASACEDPKAYIARSWPEAGDPKVEAALEAAGAPVQPTLARLDGYAMRWATIAKRVCRSEGDSQELQRERACLEDASVALSILAEELAALDEAEDIEPLFSTLPDPRRCTLEGVE
ncbi:serine/threonine kinase family protein [Plesiocystis pacifica SIR-1]|uniref:Serine/threonine kinase family protein n=1 Tax=Plesiocystis pacifica SIR-1 TaxID=391625 RepID=A6G3U2_9BACT|nr:serine/threonine-protein kinase [Plesiocystis pacifica]EDM79479.1 serine/threonine kinase family protein [Plesiocystis pacifica SIR-1]